MELAPRLTLISVTVARTISHVSTGREWTGNEDGLRNPTVSCQFSELFA